MASKFQNRLVGTIILIVLGSIILPGLLDGKKRYYQDEFTAIPLVLKPGDSNELDTTLPTQQLPSQPPEGAGEAVEQSNQLVNSDQPEVLLPNISNSSRQLKTLAPPEMKNVLPVPVRPEPKPITLPESKSVFKLQTLKVETPKTPVPKVQVWVVQLGALKNADKVSEIVAKLRLSGYRVYTLPSAPIQGQITRIFVGPNAFKEKLQSALGELNQLSGLDGQLRSYSVR